MSIAVSAPGKAFLIGEYAVLEGGVALVSAIDVRAIAHAPRGAAPLPPTAVVQCAHDRVALYLEARGARVHRSAPVVETGGFTMGARKLGLGSSAAVAAAVVGYHLVHAGLDPRHPQIRIDALDLAMGAHAEAQGGGGSGADVAAAVLGGTLRFCSGTADRITPPLWLHIGFVDAGAPADTSSFVRRVRGAIRDHRSAYEAAIETLKHAADRFLEAYGSNGDPTQLLDRLRQATDAHNDGLRQLAAFSGAEIMTRPLETIIAHAREAGLAAKPSGAGGGDLVAVFAPTRAALDRYAERLYREHGFVMLSALRSAAEGLRPEARMPTNSRLSGFFKLSVEERRAQISEATGVPLDRMRDLDHGALDMHRANHMIENVVGTMELPLAIATNFQINGRDVLVPMAIEEASVVAAASNAAKMVRAGGGFTAYSDPPWMIAQVQLLAEPSSSARGPTSPLTAPEVVTAILSHREALLQAADEAHPRLVERGGGARDIEVRITAEDMVVVHAIVDCQDAMGANLLNTVAEAIAPVLERITGWTAGLRILSNLADRRCAHVRARIPPDALASKGFSGVEVVDRIVSASRFAEVDPYRATTHNKGIMNGVDAVVLATGNDWRAMEASAHAFAARDGQYRPLATWRKTEAGELEGRLSLPAAVGVVGGSTRVHPVCRLAIDLLGCTSGAELGQIIAAAGLASNLAALRALATEGIQRGHMSLHARNVALGAGAEGAEVDRLAARMIEVGEIKADRAVTLLAELRHVAPSASVGCKAPSSPVGRKATSTLG